MSLRDKIKTHDIKFREVDKTTDGYQEGIIMLTGESELLMNMHGISIETEFNYPNIGEGLDVRDKCAVFFNHKIIFSMDQLSRMEFVKRERSEGFISSTGIKERDKVVNEIKLFNEKYDKYLSTPKIRRFNTKGGVTFSGGNGSLFCLSDPKEIVMNTEEVVKRLSINISLFEKLLSSENLTKVLFEEIHEDMLQLGCPYYTFSRPDGDLPLRLLEGKKAVELRACALIKKD